MKKQTWKMHFYKGVPCTWEYEPYDEERENYTFEADLYIKDYGRGCSSAVIYLCPWQERNKTFWDLSIKYQVFMSDSIDMIQNAVKGRIKGTFTWAKKGSNYGLQLVTAKE